MKKIKSMSYGLIVGLALGGAVSVAQAVPGEMGLIGRVTAFFGALFDRSGFYGLSGDVLLEKLHGERDLCALLDKDVPSELDGDPYSWDVLRYSKRLQLMGLSWCEGRGSHGHTGAYSARDKANLHTVDMSLGGRRSWLRVKLDFVDRRAADDVRKRIEKLADKRDLKIEDIGRGGLKLKGFADLSRWVVARTDEVREKRIESGQKAIRDVISENCLTYQPPEIRRKIMGHVFEMEEEGV